MQIENVDIKDINPYEGNPRKNEGAIDYVANSIKEFGFLVPVVIDEKDTIIAGHTRVLAAKKLKMAKVPCVRAEHLSPDQIKAFRLADNKVTEFASWDMDMLLAELDEIDLDMSRFGFEDIGDTEEDVNATDDYSEIDVETRVKRGDIWELGEHRLLCGSALDDVPTLMGGVKADLLLTDPPYNISYEGKTKERLKIQNDDMDRDEFISFLSKAFEGANASMTDGAIFYIFMASSTHTETDLALMEAGLQLRQVLVWVKNIATFGRSDYHWQHEECIYGWKGGAAHKWHGDRKQTTLLEFDKPARSAEHPTMKPLDMLCYLIKNSSRKGEVVLDIFGGSGSTLIACERLGRKCYMIELDEHYCDVILDRWEQETGQKAVKVE